MESTQKSIPKSILKDNSSSLERLRQSANKSSSLRVKETPSRSPTHNRVSTGRFDQYKQSSNERENSNGYRQ